MKEQRHPAVELLGHMLGISKINERPLSKAFAIATLQTILLVTVIESMTCMVWTNADEAAATCITVRMTITVWASPLP